MIYFQKCHGGQHFAQLSVAMPDIFGFSNGWLFWLEWHTTI